MKKIKVLSCLSTLIVMALIFSFSSQNGNESSEISQSFTIEIIRFAVRILHAGGGNETAAVEAVHWFIRKTAHFSIYAVLGISVMITVRVNTAARGAKAWLMTIGFCMLYAVSDEIHQLFSDGRTGRLLDVFIDTCGAAAGTACLVAAVKLRKRINYKFDWWITATVMIMFVIFAFSSQTRESSDTISKAAAGWVAELYNKLFADGDTVITAVQMNYYVRKTAHFMLYCVLGCVSAAMMIKKGGYKVHNAWIIAVAVASVYAASDEFHQSFVDGRGPLVSDVRLDMCGAVTGSTLYAVFYLLAAEIRDRRKISGR